MNRGPIVHELKVDPEQFHAIYQGKKKFEFRKNDRDFREGDRLYLLETVSSAAEMAQGALLEYTGGGQTVVVTYVLKGPEYGIPDGYAILSLEPDTTGEFNVPELPVWWEKFIRNLCELEDRNSPEDMPEALIATPDEMEAAAISAMEATAQ